MFLRCKRFARSHPYFSYFDWHEIRLCQSIILLVLNDMGKLVGRWGLFIERRLFVFVVLGLIQGGGALSLALSKMQASALLTINFALLRSLLR